MKKIISTFLLSISICSNLLAQKSLYTFEIGVQAYTYRNWFPKNCAATLDTIQKLGITEMEGGTTKGVSPEQFRKMCDERKIKIIGTGGDYNELVKSTAQTIADAKIYGSKYVMCAWIPHKRGEFNIENAKKAVQDFNAIGKSMKENGLIFCYHTHGFEFQPYEDGTLLDYIIKNTNPEYVSFEMDILWVTHGGGDPVKLLNKYGNRWKLMHLKDLKKGIKGDFTGGTPAENDVVLGDGQCDFVGIIKAAKKAGIMHYFIEDESNIEGTQVPKSIAYLKGLR